MRAGWDDLEGEIGTKSRAGDRVVPINARLRELLIEHGMETRRSTGLVFGRDADTPFAPATISKRAAKAWKAAGFSGLTLHEARHTFASLMLAAGANAKQIQTYMGQASISITYYRYGHLLPGDEAQAAALLDVAREVGSGGSPWARLWPGWARNMGSIGVECGRSADLDNQSRAPRDPA